MARGAEDILPGFQDISTTDHQKKCDARTTKDHKGAAAAVAALTIRY